MTKSVTIKNEDFFRIYLIIWLVGAIIAFILQMFIPQIVANSSIWDFSDGWQREIGLWNAGVIFTIIYALFLNKQEYFRFLTIVLTVLSVLLGSNHLISLIVIGQFALINFLGIIINYFAVGFGLYVFYLNKDKPLWKS
jgi:hypothetical protein